jgi:aminoglycoside phosphotransferase (APT) family kinase protein
VASGWDNVIFRLGDELAVRLPRRAPAAELVDHEQRWLPTLAAQLPLPIPTPIHAGRPGHGYPWSWSVLPWFDGDVALRTPPSDLSAAATTLGRFVRALHVGAPHDAPTNPYRGVPLSDRTQRLHDAVASLSGDVDGSAIVALWDELVEAPAWGRPSVWLHGDLHPANVIVHRGEIAAIIDWGDVTSGDPATDLAVAWMLFPPDTRLVFRTAAGRVDDATWSRARAWALALGLAYLASSADNELFSALRDS